MRPAAAADINSSEAGPVTADENFHQGDLNTDDLNVFQDATTFDFDYLSRVGNHPVASHLSRQSLFVKFDPLFGLESPKQNSLPAMSENSGLEDNKIAMDGGGATPKKNLDTDPIQKLISITPTKPETPARSKINVNSPSTPTLRQEILSKEISKLQELMVQQEQSYQEQLTTKSDMVEELLQRISELEAREPRDDLEIKLKENEAKVTKLKKELAENTLSKKQLIMIMEEYEKTISQLVTKREDEKKEFEQVKEDIAKERDTALQHLSNMEVAFNDIHQKYERCKSVIEAMKNNELLLKNSLTESEKIIKKQEADYQKLKSHASEKLEGANEELATLRKNQQGELAKMKAIAKKSEIKVKSLKESLEQKKKEIQELTQICDELIGKVENQ